MNGRIWIICGALLALAGVAAGAYGAHGLEARLRAALATEWVPETDPALEISRLMASYEVAVRYQMYHALGLILVGMLAAYRPSRWWTVVAMAFLVGMLVFCGGLYALVFTRDKAWGARVPFGGVALMVGWLALALGAWFARPPAAPGGTGQSHTLRG